MTAAEENVVLDNDRVVVRRITRSGPGPVATAKRRRDRLIIYLKDAHIRRTEGGHQEDLQRKAGDVVWRPASQHDVDLVEGAGHEVLIIEFKN
jgi:hypothetical protein